MKNKFTLGGTFSYELVRNGIIVDAWEDPNIVVDEGLTYALATSFDGTTAQLPNWYIGLFTGNYTPVNTDTASSIASNSTETTTQYDEVTRPSWVEAGVATNAIGNVASPAVFTFGVATTNVYGAFLISDATKGGALGTLAAASRFGSLRVMLDTDVLNVTYTLTASSV